MTSELSAVWAELSEVEHLIGQLSDRMDQSGQTLQADAKQIHHKLDAWIQTNRALTQSNQELLKLLTSNCEALNQLTHSYNSSISLWKDSKRQPVLSEATISSLSDGLASKLLPILQQQVQQSAQEQQLQQQIEQAGGPVNLPSCPSPLNSRSPAPKSVQSSPPNPMTGSLTMRERLSLSAEWVRQATIPFAVLGGLLLMSGSAVGYAYAHIRQPLYVVGNTLPLSLDEAELLSWARSERGRFARNLMKWNSGALDSLHCTQDVERLGVTLEVQGRAAGYGFCTLWVVPPQKRRFLESG